MKVTTESDRCPKAAVGQNWRTVSCPQDRPQTGESPPSTTTTTEDPPTFTTTTTAEDPPTTTTTEYRGRSADHYYHYYHYYLRSRDNLHLRTESFKKYRFKN